MTALAEDGPERIGIGRLMRDGLGRLRAAWLPVLVLAIVGLAASYAIETWLPMDTRWGLLEFTPLYFTRVALFALADNAPAVLALWWLLDPRARPPTAGRPVLECLAIFCLYDVALTIVVLGVNPPGAMADGATAVAIRGALVSLGRIVIEFVGLLLCLWPVGRLAGRREMTPGRALRLMRGAAPSYVVIMAALASPVVLAPVGIGLATMNTPGAYPAAIEAWSWVQWAWIQAMQMLGLAFAVAIFVQRMERPQSVGEVFA